ncbi:hypothetical protein [Pelobium manganitolerans]|uniref:hypothetical protein n=1 Tax=Pelobium manganitolerans TaxID=1842495 RepID=UPI003FA3669F
MPTLRIHTHWQVAQSLPASQNLPKSMAAQTHGRKKARLPNSVYVAIAGEVVNRRSVLLRNFVLKGQVSASNPLLHIHANRCVQGYPTSYHSST